MTRPYRHGSGRIQHRTGGGRFRHSTLADFGIAADVCEACRGITPRALGEPAPEVCQHCGAVFVRETCAWSRVREPAFMDPALFRQGAYTRCGRPAIAIEIKHHEGRCADHLDTPQEPPR